MAAFCLACPEFGRDPATQVMTEGDTCAKCEADMAVAAATLAGLAEPAGEGEGQGKPRRGPPPDILTLLRRQARLLGALQERLNRRIRATTRNGAPERGDEPKLSGLAFQLTRQLSTLADAIRKYEDEARERAKRRTHAQRVEISLAYLESGKTSRQERLAAVERLRRVDEGAA